MQQMMMVAAVAGLAVSTVSAETLLAEITFDGDQSTTTGFDTNSTLAPTSETLNPPAGISTFDGEFTDAGFFGDATDGQLGWRSFFEQFDDIDTPLDGGSDTFDELGVIAGTGVGGSNGFVMSDVDGQMVIRTDLIDLQGFNQVRIEFDLFVGNTGYEDDDFLAVTIEEDGVIGSAGSFVDGSNNLELGLADTDVFNTIVIESSILTADFVFLDIDATDFGSPAERVIWDNIRVYGIPSPGAAVLAGLGGLAAARRRRA